MISVLNKLEFDYIRSNIEMENRLDNRILNSFRNISFKKLKNNGQVRVSIGNTTVIGQIYSTLISPQKDKPNEGMISFAIDTLNLKHYAESNNLNEELNEIKNRISNLLEKSLKDTK